MYFITKNGPKLWPLSLNPSKFREHFYGRFHRPLALLMHHWTLLSSAVQVRSLYNKIHIRSKFKWQKNIWTKIYPRPQPTMMEKSKEKRICGTLKLFQLYSVKWYMPSEVQERKKMLQRRLCLYLNENNISDIAMTLWKKKRYIQGNP